MSLNDAAGAAPAAPVRLRNPRSLARRLTFAALAGFILLSPAPKQLFGEPSPWLREWVMYSGVGTGIPEGAFHIHDASGRIVETLSPLQAAGLSRYPNIKHYMFEGRLQSSEDLWRFAAASCARLDTGQRLSFEGRIGTRQGWWAEARDDVCARPEAAR